MVIATALAAAGAFAEDASRQQRGREVIRALESGLEMATNHIQRERITDQIEEVRAALENNGRPPVPERIDAFLLPVTHYRYASARVGLGTRRAANIHAPADAKELHLLDPPNSSFWTRPVNVATQNLHAGFGRPAPVDYETTVWEYVKPKDGYGGHAGFEARSGSRRIKIKFGEIRSEPFTARIFHALGYHVDPTDYSPGLKVRFDPKLFTEFNSRRPVNTRITILGALPVWTIRFQPEHDPLRFIRHAVMRDGSILSGNDLKRVIETVGSDPGIDHLVTVPANVQPKRDLEKNIGPWSFDQLGHEHRRELRGAGLLAAWLGWHDSRFENTRLRVTRRGEEIELKHYFSDVGGGLGRAAGLLSRSAEDVRGFPGVFTRPEVVQGSGRMTLPFRIINFRPIERTKAFEEMTLDDARWMALLIAQFSNKQIEDALRASGFKGPEMEEARDKLLSRRRHMLEHLGLAGSAVKSR